MNAVVTKAVSDAEAMQAARFTKVLNATENRFEIQRQSDLANLQAAEYYRKRLAQFEVASNERPSR
jgi:hypothetical protein